MRDILDGLKNFGIYQVNRYQAWVMVKIRPNGSLPLNFNSFPLPLPLIR